MRYHFTETEIKHLLGSMVVLIDTRENENGHITEYLSKKKIPWEEYLEKISDIKGVQKEIAWGSQIRSYVFMPYTLVKDHRTGHEDGRVDMVMDGNIQGFLNAYLSAASKGELENN